MLTGVIVNTLAVAAGSFLGLFIKFVASRLPGLPAGESGIGFRLRTLMMQAMSLCVLMIGVLGVLEGGNALISIFSMTIGAIIGEVLDLNGKMEKLGEMVQKNLEKFITTQEGTPSIAQGFVTSTLLFCVGAMAIVGSLQSGLLGDHATLYAKSTMDGITSIVFASSMGVGVALSAVAIFLYQGAITLLASFLAPYLGDAVIAEMTCVGSLLIIALALNMLGMTKIKVMNLVPACFLPIFLCMFM